jgi:hypothetical protein
MTKGQQRSLRAVPERLKPKPELVTQDHGGWISGPNIPTDEATDEAAEEVILAELIVSYPQWVFWKGKYTGKWWGCPPASRDLLDSDSIAELRTDVADWEDSYRESPRPPGITGMDL